MVGDPNYDYRKDIRIGDLSLNGRRQPFKTGPTPEEEGRNDRVRPIAGGGQAAFSDLRRPALRQPRQRTCFNQRFRGCGQLR
jgi:hypothetical protein